MRALPIDDMSSRHRGLRGGVGDAYYAAACVCLDRHHAMPTVFEIRQGTTGEMVTLTWEPSTKEIRDSWANEPDATEAGGCALAIAAVELKEGLLAVRRAEAGSGGDYYVGPDGAGEEDLEDCFRLEVSGTDKSNSAQLTRLLHRKMGQARAGRGNLPALAGVVGFEEQLILIGWVEDAA